MLLAAVDGTGRVCNSELLSSSSPGQILASDTDGISAASQKGRLGEVPHSILGDGGFALGPKLAKPFSMQRHRELDHDKKVFNYRSSRY